MTFWEPDLALHVRITIIFPVKEALELGEQIDEVVVGYALIS